MSDIQTAAQRYLDDGWSVVPLVKAEKRASASWQKKTYTAAQFKPDDGIALKCGEPSGHRVEQPTPKSAKPEATGPNRAAVYKTVAGRVRLIGKRRSPALRSVYNEIATLIEKAAK